MQIADESVENVIWTLGKKGEVHIVDLNQDGKAEKPFSNNLKRCELLEEKIKEIKEIINTSGSKLLFWLISRHFYSTC
jgi:hypothetical protein